MSLSPMSTEAFEQFQPLHKSILDHSWRPHAAENSPITIRNRLFSGAIGIFSVAYGHHTYVDEKKHVFDGQPYAVENTLFSVPSPKHR
jgi:hypothetical protein